MRSEYDASMTQSVLASGSGAASPRKTANVMPRVKNRIILPTVLAVFLRASTQR